MKFIELEPEYCMMDGEKVLRFRCPVHPADHKFFLPLDAWSISSEFATLTIMPSVRSEKEKNGCGAHFMVVGGLIYLFSQ